MTAAATTHGGEVIQHIDANDPVSWDEVIARSLQQVLEHTSLAISGKSACESLSLCEALP